MQAPYRDIIEKALADNLPAEGMRPASLAAAMRYAVLVGGGKRVRPTLCLAAAVATGGRVEDAILPACAIEFLHSYTLVHDDLPAMDGDEMRRGQPSVWAKFGEAAAILAGDALQALAFQVAARTPRNAAAIVEVLGEMGVGVVCGQVEELDSLRVSELASSRVGALGSFARAVPSARTTDHAFIYAHKTGDLFEAAAAMGALAADGSDAEVAALRKYARHLGLAFQYADDLIDGDGALSRDETEHLLAVETAAATDALAPLRGDTAFLLEFADSLAKRTA